MIYKKDKDIIKSYFSDYSGITNGFADAVILVESEKEVIDFLIASSKSKTPVSISGAGTGVTGGRVPFGGVVLSMELLNKIISIDKIHNTITVQSGVSVKTIKETAATIGCIFAPDPTEQNSSIGGNLATNASGSRGLKYGPTRNHVLHLRVVLSNGEVLNLTRGQCISDNNGQLKLPTLSGKTISVTLPKYTLPQIKNAAGYYNNQPADAIDIFIGQEGTLGVITEVELKLLPQKNKLISGVVFFRDMRNSWKFVANAKKNITTKSSGKNQIEPMSLEYYDKNALGLLISSYPLIPTYADAAIFFEQEVDTQVQDEAIISAQWAKLIEESGASIDDVWFSSSTSSLQETFRLMRHSLPEKVNEIVAKNKLPKVGTDIAVPDKSFSEMLEFYYAQFASCAMQWLVFGHIGESHLHANILPKTQDEYFKSKELYLLLVKKAISLGGTVSAEHGIGKLKHLFLSEMIGKNGMKELSIFKKQLDPASILCPDNIFPKELL